jgi:hypothetical protein
MLAMVLTYGTTTSYLASLEPLLNKIGYKNSGTASSWIVSSAMISGIIASFGLIKKLK